MMAAVGVVIGYVLGATAGKERLRQIVDSIEEIANSQEFKDMISLSGTIAAGLLREAIDRTESTDTRQAMQRAAALVKQQVDKRLARLEGE